MRRTVVAAAIVALAETSACGRIGYTVADDDGDLGASDATRPTDDGNAGEDASSETDALSERETTADAIVADGFDSGLCGTGQCKRAFVSSATTHGGFGGLDMGDQFCQRLADAVGLAGVFKAWLSDTTTNADSRFSHPTVPYRLIDGTPIANQWSDLIDGTLAHAIDMYETGARADLASSHVWTGTTRTGRTTSSDCGGWLSTSAQLNGGVGFLNSASTTWTAVSIDSCDRNDVHLYCFEQ